MRLSAPKGGGKDYFKLWFWFNKAMQTFPLNFVTKISQSDYK